MTDFFQKLFDTSGFPPRWQCGDWTEGHGWLHVLSDLGIFGAYAAIPLSIIVYTVVKKQEVAFRKLYWLFAAFILFCGLTHLIDATLFWHPWYRLSGTMKLATAIVSWSTVIALIQILPVAMRLPGTARLADQLSREVDEHRRSETELRLTANRLSLAMEHAGLAEWDWQADTQSWQFSSRAAEMLGLPPDIKTDWKTVLKRIRGMDRKRMLTTFRTASLLGRDIDEAFEMITSDHQTLWLSSKGRAITDSEGKVTRIIGTVADITSRKSAEQEREKLLADESEARASAERANKMKDEFLATLSHELRTPLNAILGWTTLLKNELDEAEEVKKGLEVIERNGRMQARLIEDLLDMNRIVTGKMGLDKRTLDLREVVRDAVEAIGPFIEAKSIQLESSLGEEMAPVYGDPARLQQVTWNLLSNAVKFTPDFGRILVGIEKLDAVIRLSIRDTGIGIDPEFLPLIFEKFRQADSSTTRSYGGLGLGLAIVRSFVEMHEGTVQAFSDGKNTGSTFLIELPIAESIPPPIEAARPSLKDPIHLHLAGRKIMVVDDDPDSLSLVENILTKHGATVSVASSAHDGLSQLTAGRFDALISDLSMPGMDGFELIKTVRKMSEPSTSQIPATALTAMGKSDDSQRAFDAGFDAFLAKPVSPTDLVDTVMRIASRNGHPTAE